MSKISLYVLLITGNLVLLSACSGKSEKEYNSNEKPVIVTVTTASHGIPPAIVATGQVEAAQITNISTRVMGRITNILVKIGDRVTKGQLLARVWDDDIRAKRAQADAMIAEAESGFATAQKDYDRFNNLYKVQSATAKEVDMVTLQFNSAKAKVNAAKQMRSEVNANLSYSTLTAPFSGVVTQKLAEIGSLASPGTPILTIEQDGILQVSASIAEPDIAGINQGDIATVEIKSTGKRFEGKIAQVNPSSQFTGGQYIIKISIPDTSKKDIYPGMFANVTIHMKGTVKVKNDAVMVPLSAIVYRDQLSGIYTVSVNNTALLRWTRLGKTYGDHVEVLSGLSENEKFISSSQSKLDNGTQVIVKEIKDVSMSTGTDQLSSIKSGYQYGEERRRYD